MTCKEITYPHLESPADELSIFVSHLWSDEFCYDKLINLFNECLKHSWKNHSIPRKEQIDIAEELSSRNRKLTVLETERINRISNRIINIEKMIESLKNELYWGISVADLQEKSERAILDLKKRQAGEILIEAERKYQYEKIRVFKESQSRPDRKSKIKDLLSLQSELDQFYRERDCAERQLDDIEKNEDTYLSEQRYSLDDYSVDSFHRGGTYGTIDYGSIRIIELAVYSRIEMADVLILIASMYSQHKAWMDYEFRVAHRFKVPVIAISLEHQEKFPQEIIKQCDNLIVWNRKKICSTLRDMLNRKQLIQSHIIAKNY